MARDIINDEIISNEEQLVNYLKSGEKACKNFKVGTENETFVFYLKNNTPVPYEGEISIKAILEKLQQKTNSTAILDNGNIIGMTMPGGAAISIEPGGQFELSGAPLTTICETEAELKLYIKMLTEIAESMHIGFLNMGANPLTTIENTPKMPKSRYKIMDNYMSKVGSTGHNMMYGTATVQANLDFFDESDMRNKMQLGMKLQPLATALFAASPFSKGSINGYYSWRAAIWHDTDKQRTGLLSFVWNDNFGYADYVAWALNVNMYFIVRNSIYIDCTHMKFKEFLANGYKGYKATMGDFINHLSTLFPEVRLKTYIEMRGADCGLPDMLCALPAFWVGLLYSKKSIEKLLSLTHDWSFSEVQELLYNVPKSGLQTKFRNYDLQNIAKEVVNIAIEGLIERPYNEELFLEPLQIIANSGKTIAQNMLDNWNGDIKTLFNEYAMIK